MVLAFISPDYGAYKANEPLITVDANVVEELAILIEALALLGEPYSPEMSDGVGSE